MLADGAGTLCVRVRFCERVVVQPLNWNLQLRFCDRISQWNLEAEGTKAFGFGFAIHLVLDYNSLQFYEKIAITFAIAYDDKQSFESMDDADFSNSDVHRTDIHTLDAHSRSQISRVTTLT